jgi:hypothetical protein
MPHVWPIFGAVVPESRRALAAVAAFISRSWAAKEIPV